jgi:hypothetical protein
MLFTCALKPSPHGCMEPSQDLPTAATAAVVATALDLPALGPRTPFRIHACVAQRSGSGITVPGTATATAAACKNAAAAASSSASPVAGPDPAILEGMSWLMAAVRATSFYTCSFCSCLLAG